MKAKTCSYCNKSNAKIIGEHWGAWSKHSGYVNFYLINSELFLCEICQLENFLSCSECWTAIAKDYAGYTYESKEDGDSILCPICAAEKGYKTAPIKKPLKQLLYELQ